MSESLQAIFQHVIWNFCYLSVLLGLSAFGIHRYFIIYLFLKNRRKHIEPATRVSGPSHRHRAVAGVQRILRDPTAH